MIEELEVRFKGTEEQLNSLLESDDLDLIEEKHSVEWEIVEK